MINFKHATETDLKVASKKASRTRKAAMEFSISKYMSYGRCMPYYDGIGTVHCPLCKRYQVIKKNILTCVDCPLKRKGDRGTCCKEWRDIHKRVWSPYPVQQPLYRVLARYIQQKYKQLYSKE